MGKCCASRTVPYSPFAERRQPSAPPYASAVLPGQFILEDNRVYWLTSVLNEGSSGATRSQLWPAPGVRFQSSPAPKNECYVLARAFPVRRLRSLMTRGAAGSRIPRTVRFVIRGCSYAFVKSLWVYARFVSTHLSVSPVPGPGCIPRRKDTPFGSAEVSIDRRQAICLRWAFSGNHDGQWQQGKRILKVATAGTPEYCRRGARSAGRTLSKSLNSDWSAAKLPVCSSFKIRMRLPWGWGQSRGWAVSGALCRQEEFDRSENTSCQISGLPLPIPARWVMSPSRLMAILVD